LFVSAPSPPPAPVDARTGLSYPPSHLVPLSSSVAMKKKKKRRERAALLAESRISPTSHGYASPIQPPAVTEQSRSRSRGRSVSANYADSFYHQSPQAATVQSTSRSRSASRSHRLDSSPPESVGFAVTAHYIIY